MSLVAEVARRVRLSPGTYEYRVRFKVPEDAPLSFAGGLLGTSYSVQVHVDIPFWPDALDTFNIAVISPLRPRPAPQPRAQTTANGAEPFLELSVDDVVVAPGERLTGALAAGHVGGSLLRRIRLSLIAEERAVSGTSRWERSGAHAVYFLPVGDIGSGVPAHFNIAIPTEVTPSFRSGTATLTWWLEARLERTLRPDLVSFIGLDVGAFSSPRPATVGARALLGSERWRRRWQDAGARHGLALDPEDLVLTGEIAGAETRVAMSADGQSFAVNLAFAPLGIGLEVSRRRLPFGGIDVDDEAPTFARRFRVSAREAAQARAVLSLDLRHCLVAFEEASIDDGSARASLPGEDRDKIGAAVDLVDALAQAIARARERIPPPAAMAASLGAWTAFAEDHQGTLSRGDMRVEGRLGGVPFTVATEFDGATPVRTRITARIDPPLPAPIDASDLVALGAKSRAAVALVGELASHGKLTIDEERITLLVARALADPGEHAPTVASLFRLAGLLRGDAGAGPYR
jgi:hypothetical protein